jgi:hypothetical protein
VTITWLVRPARFSAAPTARLGLPRRRSSRPSAMGSADGCSVLLWCRASDPPTLEHLGSTRTRHQLLDLGKRCGLGHTAGHTLTRRMLLFRRSFSPWEPWAPLVVLGALGGSSPERIAASCPQVLLFLLACVSISASGTGRLPPVPDAPFFPLPSCVDLPNVDLAAPRSFMTRAGAGPRSLSRAPWPRARRSSFSASPGAPTCSCRIGSPPQRSSLQGAPGAAPFFLSWSDSSCRPNRRLNPSNVTSCR